MAKKTIRLTEGDLHKIIKESVETILNEGEWWNGFKNVSKRALYGVTHPSKKDYDKRASYADQLDAEEEYDNYMNTRNRDERKEKELLQKRNDARNMHQASKNSSNDEYLKLKRDYDYKYRK